MSELSQQLDIKYLFRSNLLGLEVRQGKLLHPQKTCLRFPALEPEELSSSTCTQAFLLPCMSRLCC